MWAASSGILSAISLRATKSPQALPPITPLPIRRAFTARKSAAVKYFRISCSMWLSEVMSLLHTHFCSSGVRLSCFSISVQSVILFLPSYVLSSL